MGINSQNIGTTEVHCPKNSSRKGAEQEKTKKTLSIDTIRFQVTYIPYGRSMLERQQQKHPKGIKKKLSGPGGKARPPPAAPQLGQGCRRRSLLCPPQPPWPCCPQGPAPTAAPEWQRDGASGLGAEGGGGGNLGSSLRKLALAHRTRPDAERQWTVSPAICRARSLEGFGKYSVICNSDHLRPFWQVATLQFNSYRACATTAAPLPFLLSFYYDSCASAVVVGPHHDAAQAA